MKAGKAQEKVGVFIVSTLLSLVLYTKDVSTAKEASWIGGSLEGYFDRDDCSVST